MKKWLTIATIIGFTLGVLLTHLMSRHYLNLQSVAAYAYGVELMEKGNIDKAVSVLNQSIGINPRNYQPYITLGKIYEKQNKIEIALVFYKKALEICGGETYLELADRKFIEDRIQQISVREKTGRSSTNN